MKNTPLAAVVIPPLAIKAFHDPPFLNWTYLSIIAHISLEIVAP
jgi:hypothetical protein